MQVFVFCAVAYPLQALLLAPPIPAALAVTSYELVRHPHPQDTSSARRTPTVAAGAAVSGVAMSGTMGLILGRGGNAVPAHRRNAAAASYVRFSWTRCGCCST